MGDKSAYTKKSTDWLGREIEEHYDSAGRKIGETRFASDWFGSPKQEHYDTHGNKIGESRKGSDWLGSERAEHFDSEGNRVGYSRNEVDWLGRPVQSHYAVSGDRIGTTRRGQSWMGQARKEHEGTFFKANVAQSQESTSDAYASVARSSSTVPVVVRGGIVVIGFLILIIGLLQRDSSDRAPRDSVRNLNQRLLNQDL